METSIRQIRTQIFTQSRFCQRNAHTFPSDLLPVFFCHEEIQQNPLIALLFPSIFFFPFFLPFFGKFVVCFVPPHPRFQFLLPIRFSIVSSSVLTHTHTHSLTHTCTNALNTRKRIFSSQRYRINLAFRLHTPYMSTYMHAYIG